MFKAIGKAIVFVVDGIAKICALILLTFGMFIPMLYTIIFFVFKIIFKFQFTSMVSLIFFIGLSLSVLGGLYFAFCRLRKRIGNGKNLDDNRRKMIKRDIATDKKNDKQRSAERYAIKQKKNQQPQQDGFDYSPTQQPKNKKSDISNSTIAQQSNNYAPPQPQQYMQPQQQYMQPQQQYAPQPQQYAPQPQQFAQQQQYTQPQQYEQTNEDMQANEPQPPKQQSQQQQKYSESQRMQFERKYGNQGMQNQQEQQGQSEQALAPEQLLTAEAENLLNRLEGCRNEETPLIFELKNSTDTFVYEFSDRLQFFKKQGNKMILIKTQYKKSTGEIKR